MARDIMDVLADWQQFQRTERGASVRTSCIMPSGSLLSVSVQPAIDGWIVSDEGSAVYEATCAGGSIDLAYRGFTSRVSKRGLKVDNGKIFSERVGVSELPYMVAYVATAALDAAIWLSTQAKKSAAPTLEMRLPEFLDQKYPDFRMPEPLSLIGKSSKNYSFKNVLLLPNRDRLILDPVAHSDGSIKSKLVANLDVRQAEHARLHQRIVYDDSEPWDQPELALLSVGAPAVPFSRLGGVVDRMAA